MNPLARSIPGIKMLWYQTCLPSSCNATLTTTHTPARSYQCLRHFDDVPQLPWGYYEMFLLAYIPPLWFKVMDKRVIEWAGGDLEKINVLPGKREKYAKKLALSA